MHEKGHEMFLVERKISTSKSVIESQVEGLIEVKLVMMMMRKKFERKCAKKGLFLYLLSLHFCSPYTNPTVAQAVPKKTRQRSFKMAENRNTRNFKNQNLLYYKE